MNLDNFSEVKKTSKVIRAGLNSKSSVIFRNRASVFALTRKWNLGPFMTSTATATSKFGIALRDHEQDLIKAYAENPWLNAMHVHVGSQGCPLTLSARGAATVFEFAKKINKAVVGRAQIHHFDIGGGVLPTTTRTGNPGSTGFRITRRRLRRRVAVCCLRNKRGWLCTQRWVGVW